MHLDLMDAQTLESGICQRNNFRIGSRCGCAKYFHAKLVMLTQAALLYVLIPVIRHDIIALEGQSLGIQGIFQISTDRGCSALRTQGNRSAALIGEGIHFLLYHIGSITDAPVEQLGMFKIRETDFFKSVLHGDGAQYTFYIMPFIYLRWYNILCALGGFDEFCHKWLFLSGRRVVPALCLSVHVGMPLSRLPHWRDLSAPVSAG